MTIHPYESILVVLAETSGRVATKMSHYWRGQGIGQRGDPRVPKTRCRSEAVRNLVPIGHGCRFASTLRPERKTNGLCARIKRAGSPPPMLGILPPTGAEARVVAPGKDPISLADLRLQCGTGVEQGKWPSFRW